jgi:hypothetical protein
MQSIQISQRFSHISNHLQEQLFRPSPTKILSPKHKNRAFMLLVFKMKISPENRFLPFARKGHFELIVCGKKIFFSLPNIINYSGGKIDFSIVNFWLEKWKFLVLFCCWECGNLLAEFEYLKAGWCNFME